MLASSSHTETAVKLVSADANFRIRYKKKTNSHIILGAHYVVLKYLIVMTGLYKAWNRISAVLRWFTNPTEDIMIWAEDPHKLSDYIICQDFDGNCGARRASGSQGFS